MWGGGREGGGASEVDFSMRVYKRDVDEEILTLKFKIYIKYQSIPSIMLLNDFPTFPRYKFLRNPKFQVPNHPTLLENILQKLPRPPQQPQTSDHAW